MRFLICVLLFFALQAPLAVAGDMPSENRPSFLFRAVESPLDPSAAQGLFLKYSSDETTLFDIPDFRDRGWFKGGKYIYWFVVAARAYRDDGGFKHRRLIGQESAMSAGFDFGGWRRATLIPRRSMPFVAFPLEKGAAIDSMLAVSVTKGGIAFMYARTFGPPRPRCH